MAKATKSKKKPIDQYDHKGKKRVNNPPVGLVTPETDKETGKKKYAYDPHIDPALQFDSQRSQVEKIIDHGLSGETFEEVKAALQELKKRQAPYLNWARKDSRYIFFLSKKAADKKDRSWRVLVDGHEPGRSRWAFFNGLSKPEIITEPLARLREVDCYGIAV